MRNIRRQILASALFFIVLSCWAFAAPIGAGGDSDHHISSIWCGQGERQGLCEDRGWYETGYQARVPFMFQMCNGRPIEFFPDCAEIDAQPAMQFLRTATPDKVNAYYKTMSYVVSENTHQSILKIRLLNALISSLVLFALLTICKGKIRTAVVASWTVGLIPLGVQFFSNVNPRSWSYLAVFSSWAFLAAGLEMEKQSRQKIAAYLLSAFTALLAFATRIDGSIFVVFSCAIVLAVHILKSYSISKKTILISSITVLIGAFLVRSFSQLSSNFSFNLDETIASSRFFLIQLVHGPEFIAQAWGYNVGQQGNGPGLIGIIGLSLFAVTLAFSLIRGNTVQILGVLIIAVFMISAQMRGSIAIGGLIPASGDYVMALTVFLLGFSVWTSTSPIELYATRGGRIATMFLLTFSHAIALFSYMEFYVKRGFEIGTFKTISLEQQWWWNSDISPNLVFWLGSAALAPFLYFMLSTVSQPMLDEQ
jgi:hypothetical protein